MTGDVSDSMTGGMPGTRTHSYNYYGDGYGVDNGKSGWDDCVDYGNGGDDGVSPHCPSGCTDANELRHADADGPCTHTGYGHDADDRYGCGHGGGGDDGNLYGYDGGYGKGGWDGCDDGGGSGVSSQAPSGCAGADGYADADGPHAGHAGQYDYDHGYNGGDNEGHGGYDDYGGDGGYGNDDCYGGDDGYGDYDCHFDEHYTAGDSCS